MKHYLDYNATAPARPEVLTVMQELQSLPLNSSSVHSAGRRAKAVIEDARRTIAEVISAFPNEIVFVGSGTEANNWAMRAFAGRMLLVSAIEHSSVLKTAQVISKPVILKVNADGVVDAGTLESLLPSSRTKSQDLRHNALALDPAVKPQDDNFLVSVMLANNETGAIQPIKEIAELVHAKGGLLHCDAVQAFGKIPVNFSDLNCDLMTISGHKMGGPVGAAALVIRNNLVMTPMLTGGGQELNRRAGTENIANIAGFAKAAELIDLTHMKMLRLLLDKMEAELHEGRVIGKEAPRLPNTTCITMPNVPAETQLITFDLEGIAVSAGSACSSGRVEPSHVLKAMEIDDKIASTAIRISAGWATVDKDIDRFTAVWKKLFQSKNVPMH